jgi:hypothetical protein
MEVVKKKGTRLVRRSSNYEQPEYTSQKHQIHPSIKEDLALKLHN